MKDMQWTTIDKSAWPRGPWDNEPDKVQWLDRETRRPCIALRHPEHGHWCGYVGVSEGHPLFEKSDRDGETGEVSVHGGITFGGFCSPEPDKERHVCHVVEPGENDHVWWLGFDCAHSQDRGPISRPWMRCLLEGENGPVYRDLPYVQDQCRSLARQLKAMQA